MKHAFAVDRGVPADACGAHRLAAHDLELHALIRELIIDAEAHVLVPHEVRFQVVVEDVKIVRMRQRVLEGNNVDLVKLWRRVPVDEDHGVCIDDADVRWRRFRCHHFEFQVKDLQNVPDNDDVPCILSGVCNAPEVGADVLVEQDRRVLACVGRLVVPQANELNLFEPSDRVALHKVVRLCDEHTLVRFAFHHNELVTR
mmetsp:Transcript_136399/g.380194  ORF Transcript_136399/g.380194 Transcript_136399/m.380194 type:complete len:200 (-) Transcript_136399:94-693(-)